MDRHKYGCLTGETPTEITHHLAKKVDKMSKEYRQAVKNIERELERLTKLKVWPGAYYDKEVKVEDGYSTEDETAYKLITIPSHDCEGERIKFDLHLAYNNTTNSDIREGIFDASQFTLADKMFTASVGPWYGHTRYHGAQLPSVERDDLYTLAVLPDGKLTWYNNTVDDDRLDWDKVVNSTGCTGLLVNNHQATTATYWGEEKLVQQKTWRIAIGQDYKTRNIYILVCGAYDTDTNTPNEQRGMTPAEAARIMAGYCDIAVNMCLGEGVDGTDKGDLMVIPSNGNESENTLFWYISKSKHYRDKYTFELATLAQLYGQLKWRNRLTNELAVQALWVRINELIASLASLASEVDDIQAVIVTIQSHLDALDAKDVELQTGIDGLTLTVTSIVNDIVTIMNDITALQGRMTTAESNIASNTSRINGIDSTINQINNNIIALDADISSLQYSVSQLQSKVSTLTSNYSILTDRVDNLDTLITSVQTQLTNTDALFAALSADFIELKELVNTVEPRVTEVEQEFATIQSEWSDIETAWATMQEKFTALSELVDTFDGRISDLENIENENGIFHYIEQYERSTTLNVVKNVPFTLHNRMQLPDSYNTYYLNYSLEYAEGDIDSTHNTDKYNVKVWISNTPSTTISQVMDVDKLIIEQNGSTLDVFSYYGIMLAYLYDSDNYGNIPEYNTDDDVIRTDLYSFTLTFVNAWGNPAMQFDVVPLHIDFIISVNHGNWLQDRKGVVQISVNIYPITAAIMPSP